jgi:hypothetical protein
MQTELITESWNDPRFTILEQKRIIPFVKSIEAYIVEAKLTPDQISQLFTSVEQGATAAGSNRSGIGKAVDVAKLPVEAVKFIDKKINDLGRAIQNTSPVKNLDQKFEQLKAKIGAKDSKVVQGIKAVSDWAIANPGKASIAVAILTTAAAMAGGPMGGAIAGFLARATKDLLQGEKLSTAAGKSAKTGIVGALLGMGFKYLSDNIIGNIAADGDASLKASEAAFKSANAADAMAEVDPDLAQYFGQLEGAQNLKMMGNINSFNFNYDVILTPEQLQQYSAFRSEIARLGAGDAFSQATLAKQIEFHNWMSSVQQSADQPLLRSASEALRAVNAAGRALSTDQISALAAAKNDLAGQIKVLSSVGDTVASAVQGATTAAEKAKTTAIKSGPPPQTAPAAESKKFTTLQIETLIEWCDDTPQVLHEGPLDALKKGAAAVGGAIKKGVGSIAQAGKNLTTKVTADKLNKAWVKAGSPDDSDKIADVLRTAGVSDEVLAPIFKQMGATLPPAPAAPTAEPTTPGAAPTAEPTTPGTPAASGAPTTPGAPTTGAAPAASGGIDFNGVQKAINTLSQQDAKQLVTYIDSLASKPAATPSTTNAPAAGATAPTSTPAAPGAANTATPAAGKAVPTKNAAAGDTYEKAKGDIRKVQSGTKPLPEPMAAGISSDIAKLAKGDKESGVAAADKIMKFAQRGMDVAKLQQAWIANSKAGERFLTQSVYFEITRMLKEHGLRWSDLGLRVHLVESTNEYVGISQL